MTSHEVDSVVKAFVNQVRGLLPGLEKLPAIVDEIEQREFALLDKEPTLSRLDTIIAEKEQRVGALDLGIPGKEARSAELSLEIKAKMVELKAQEDKLAQLKADYEVWVKEHLSPLVCR